MPQLRDRTVVSTVESDLVWLGERVNALLVNACLTRVLPEEWRGATGYFEDELNFVVLSLERHEDGETIHIDIGVHSDDARRVSGGLRAQWISLNPAHAGLSPGMIGHLDTVMLLGAEVSVRTFCDALEPLLGLPCRLIDFVEPLAPLEE